MSWFLTILFAILTITRLSEAKHAKKLPSAVVVGTVYCDTCFQQDFDRTSHFISGATVAVECKYGTSSRPVFREEAKTDGRGEFKVHLPFSVSKHVKKIEECSVKLISSSEPYCAVASTATSSALHLKSRKQGTHIFSAGFFTFKPLKQPSLCNQKPSIQKKSKELQTPMVNKASLHSNDPGVAFPPPLQDPNTPGDLPPLPALPNLPPLVNLPPLPPLPKLPPLPTLPGLLPPLISGDQKIATTKPITKSSSTSHDQETDTKTNQEVSGEDFFFPPNPFQPPPLIPNPFQPPPLIPNPFQPSPPPLFPNPFQPPPAPPLFPNPFQPPPAPPLFPNPFQPPPAPTPLFPPLPPFPFPGLTPSPPPPPPPPVFPFPFPPFPFPIPPPRSPGPPPS
ncbi:hypothetical protein TIFTF001_026668 [Ficus carica]|uniref:Uncharacterized protein n=1 Tax=Ficus carica TaxID=3494 RepID=A0AA88DLJ0_FICCA|nr:hypothetical protein TIFTF001_026668 [Ficus carica]